MSESRVLVVDDQRAICDFCKKALHQIEDVSVKAEHLAQRALGLLDEGNFDFILSDINMPEASGMDILKRSKNANPETPVIIMTGYPSMESCIECVQLGAADYVLKPLILEDLLMTVRRVLEQARLTRENRLLKRQLNRTGSMGDIIGKSEPIENVKQQILALGDTNVDVLISGDTGTGTGKEMVARNVHSQGARADEQFVPVDCSGISPDLFESEFFGHERGAFTGATERTIGWMEYADKGTLILDEVGELSLPQQAKLLRVLQERKFRRVGSREEVSVDIRLLAATNRDLKEEVKAGRFREDLFFRICVGEILLPPLKQRRADIPRLLEQLPSGLR
jgi:DNA-binding NtrC family response regulator